MAPTEAPLEPPRTRGLRLSFGRKLAASFWGLLGALGASFPVRAPLHACVQVVDPDDGFHGDSDGSRAETHGVRTLTLAEPLIVRLNQVRLRIGLTTDERNSLVAACAREPAPDECLEYLARIQSSATIVSVAAFLLDRTETTLGDYANCMRAGHCPRIADPSLALAESSRLPVAFVDRDAARAFCKYRGGRLPTQLEFERAVRGVPARLFPWGHIYNGMASNHGRFGANPLDPSDGFLERASVGTIQNGTSPEGVFDLAGNVAEWVETAEAPQFEAARTPSAPALVCGGSYRTGAIGLVGGACIATSPHVRRMEIGFRCAYDAHATKG